MKTPMTQAIRVLKQHSVEFEPHLYKYEEKGGSAVSSRELGVDEHIVIKTLIMETDTKTPLIVLMHGDCEVSTKNLARIIGVKSIGPCKPDIANKHSGYLVGGTSPFGTKKQMNVYMQETILSFEKVYINAGSRGFLVALAPQDIVKVLSPKLVDIVA